MTVSDWKKILKQLEGKPAIKARYMRFNKPKDRLYHKKMPKMRKNRGTSLPIWIKSLQAMLQGNSRRNRI